MIDVIYPYIKSKQGQELKYSLRSLEANFNEEFRVILFGNKPDQMTNVTHIEDVHPKFKEVRTRQINKRRIMHWLDISQKPFIQMNDDIYFTNKVTINDINKPYVVQNLDRITKPTKMRAQKQKLQNTYDYCKKLGCTGYNFETHMPYYYTQDSAVYTMNTFDPILGWTFNTAYWNLTLEERKVIPMKFVKVGLYSKRDFNITDNILFFNHNDNGLSNKVKKYLNATFPNKSRFEK